MQIVRLSPQQPNLTGLMTSDVVCVLCDTSLSSFSVQIPYGKETILRQITIANIGSNGLTIYYNNNSPLYKSSGNLTALQLIRDESVSIINDRLTGTWYAINKINYTGFAEIHVHDNSTSQAIATGTSYTKLTCFTDNGEHLNVTPDVVNGRITLIEKGCYKISGSFSFSCGTNNTTFFGAPFLNNIEIDSIHWERKISTAGDKGNASFTGIINNTVNNSALDVRVRHDNAGSVNITVYYANFNIEYIGRS